jgi:thiol:disulfide interchange protein
MTNKKAIAMNPALRPVVVIGLIVLGVATVVGISEWRAAHAKELIPWRSDLAAAQAEATAGHKPVFAYFTAKWCGPCQQMKSTTWSDNSVNDAMASYVPVKIDVDEHPDLAKRFEITAMPTYRILSPDDGTIVRGAEGRMEPEQMARWLKK